MVTIHDNRWANGSARSAGDHAGYSTYQEPDTRVPPKARPVFSRVAVNGIAIPEADILAEAQHHPAANPGQALAAAARALVVRELLRQEALRSGVKAESRRDTDGCMETPEDAAIRALIAHDVRVPSANDAECRRYYENNRALFTSQPIYEARHILIAAAASDHERRVAAQCEAERLICLLKDHPGGFADLARAFSDCPSREQGGSLGQVTPGSTVPEFERALAAMAPGELAAQPVESRYGFHVVVLDRKIPAKELPFEMVRDGIAQRLRAACWSKAVAQYISILAGRAEICGIGLDAAEGPLIQ